MSRLESINNLLLKEDIKENFNRYDILVRYYTIREYLSLNPEAFHWYRHMQFLRVGHRIEPNMCIEIFKKWIAFYLYFKSSISRNIEVDICPIPVANDNGRIVDGSHRLSCSVYFNETEVPIFDSDKNWGKGVDYGRKWFEKHDFDMKLLENIRQEIIQKRNL